MGKIIDQAFMQLVQTLTLQINLSLKNGNLGNKRSSAKGSSVEFSDYREYIPGDDFRRIDWNAIARFEKVFIKLFMEEQESPVTLFLDRSTSMDFKGKKEAAIKVTATFAYAALADYDTVSIALFNEKTQNFLSGLRGGAAFNRVIDMLETTEFSGESNLYDVVYNWQTRFKKGITVITSDFMYDSRFEEVMKLLSFHKQRVVICHVLSKEELQPIIDENMRLVDSENHEYMDIQAGAEAVKIYQEALLRYMNGIKKVCKKYGADYLLIDSSKPIENFIKHVHGIR